MILAASAATPPTKKEEYFHKQLSPSISESGFNSEEVILLYAAVSWHVFCQEEEERPYFPGMGGKDSGVEALESWCQPR